MACSSGTAQVVPGTPVATLTVVFGQSQTSPTPPLLPYYCGGWATDTTPGYSANGIINVYGKFTQTVSGNPVGVPNASADASVLWPDGNVDNEHTTTSSDGLAVFSIPMKASAINHVVLIQMKFTSSTGYVCKIPQAAFFTAILVSPTATNTAGASPTTTPSVTPTAGGNGSPTTTPTITPTKTVKPGG